MAGRVGGWALPRWCVLLCIPFFVFLAGLVARVCLWEFERSLLEEMSLSREASLESLGLHSGAQSTVEGIVADLAVRQRHSGSPEGAAALEQWVRARLDMVFLLEARVRKAPVSHAQRPQLESFLAVCFKAEQQLAEALLAQCEGHVAESERVVAGVDAAVAQYQSTVDEIAPRLADAARQLAALGADPSAADGAGEP